jgi:hypothetical protein
MNKFLAGTAYALLLLSSATVAAAPIATTVGVGAATGTLDCARTTDGNCAWKSTSPTGYDSEGRLSSTPLSGASSVSDARGTASAWGEANFSSYLPSLHAYARSNGAYTSDFSSLAGTRSGPSGTYTGAGSGVADANVWAVQGYQYTGTSPFELTVTAVLDSQFSASGDNGKIGHSGFRVSIFDARGYVFDPNQDSLDFSTSLCPLFNGPSRFCAGSPTVFAYASDTQYDTGSISVTVSYTFNPGDKFFVGAFLDASVCCGLTADSSHTLNLAFNDFTQLESIPVPGVVPEPGSVVAFVTGLLLLAGRRRKPA